MKKQYINPVCKVMTLNTMRSILDIEEPILATSEPDRPIEANHNPMEFDDAVDEFVFGKKEK